MKIEILSAEESVIFWEKEKQERLKWTADQIVDDAKLMLSLPDAGNTKWITTAQYPAFLYWLRTREARQIWNENPYTLDLAKHYSQK